MNNRAGAEWLRALIGTLTLAFIVGLIYPIIVWGIAQFFFPTKANGSLLYEHGTVIGSTLIGQNFSGPEYFHPRPSAAGNGYDPTASGGSNLGPLSKSLIEKVKNRLFSYRQENELSSGIPIPVDAITSSASGLDPDISLENARLQVSRIAKIRRIRREEILALIDAHIQGHQLGILGEPRVNVLILNLCLKNIPSYGK